MQEIISTMIIYVYKNLVNILLYSIILGDDFMEEDLNKLIEQMLSHSSKPSKVVQEILEYEQKHISYMVSEYHKFILQFEHAYELIVDLMIALNYFPKDNFPKHRSTQIILLNNNLKPLFSGFERLKRGFYEDSLTLFRVCYDTIIRIYFISFYPKDFEAVLVDKLPEGRRRFNLTNFIKNDLDVDWSYLYSLMSHVSHANRSKTLIDILSILRNGQKTPIQLEFKIDTELMSSSINILYFICWNYLKIFFDLFIRPQEKKFNQDILRNLIDTEKVYSRIIQAMPNKISNSYGDVIKIYKKIKEKEEAYGL